MTQDPRPPHDTSQAEAVPQVTQRDLPEAARRRLQKLRGSFFTSDLSVNEFLLVKEVGFHPRGLVVGSSIYHIGLQATRWGRNQELETISQAMYTARELAMERMEEEAVELDADGIVGVRLNIRLHEWGKHSAEFIAVGTAVSAEDGANWKAPRDRPFTSDLTGQDFWTLVQSGYAPLGLVMGTCVYHVAHRSMAQTVAATGRNVELPQFTMALYQARELAMERMQTEAENLGAEGIVGVQLVEKSHFWGSHVIEFLAIGTAIRPLRADHVIAPPQMIMTLDR